MSIQYVSTLSASLSPPAQSSPYLTAPLSPLPPLLSLWQVQAEGEAKRMQRADYDGPATGPRAGAGGNAKMMNVMLSERRVKTAARYQAADVPHPYSSREEYERAVSGREGGATM
jgi:hypothetical protein